MNTSFRTRAQGLRVAGSPGPGLFSLAAAAKRGNFDTGAPAAGPGAGPGTGTGFTTAATDGLIKAAAGAGARGLGKKGSETSTSLFRSNGEKQQFVAKLQQGT